MKKTPTWNKRGQTSTPPKNEGSRHLEIEVHVINDHILVLVEVAALAGHSVHGFFGPGRLGEPVGPNNARCRRSRRSSSPNGFQPSLGVLVKLHNAIPASILLLPLLPQAETKRVWSWTTRLTALPYLVLVQTKDCLVEGHGISDWGIERCPSPLTRLLR